MSPNTAVTPARIRVWMIEAVVLMLMLLGIVYWLSSSLSDERSSRHAGEVALFTSGCKRINTLSQGARDSITDGLRRQNLLDAEGKPVNEVVQNYLEQQFDRFQLRDCSRIPAILSGD